jgi:hypothetical protein
MLVRIIKNLCFTNLNSENVEENATYIGTRRYIWTRTVRFEFEWCIVDDSRNHVSSIL